MRSARIRTQETQARERGRLAEKEAKFQKRHGYTAGLFPGLPDFKMPKARAPHSLA